MATFTGDDNGNLFKSTRYDDTFLGKGGKDTVAFVYATGGVRADLALTGAQNTYWGNDTFSSIEDLMGTRFGDTFYGNGETNYLYGYAGNDRFWGRGGVDELFGDSGDDYLHGGDGNDYIDGGTGTDTINGGPGRDWVRYFMEWNAVVVDLAKTGAQDTRNGLDTLISIENAIGSDYADRLLGNDQANELKGHEGNDRLYGRAGNDNLEGEEGSDFLHGGSGRDVLSGGVGADRFVFTQLADFGFGATSDRIADFEDGADKINLRLIDLDASVDGRQAFVWSDEDFFSGKKGELIYLIGSSSGPTHIYADLDGDRRADIEIRLAGAHVLDEADFLL